MNLPFLPLGSLAGQDADTLIVDPTYLHMMALRNNPPQKVERKVLPFKAPAGHETRKRRRDAGRNFR